MSVIQLNDLYDLSTAVCATGPDTTLTSVQLHECMPAHCTSQHDTASNEAETICRFSETRIQYGRVERRHPWKLVVFLQGCAL